MFDSTFSKEEYGEIISDFVKEVGIFAPLQQEQAHSALEELIIKYFEDKQSWPEEFREFARNAAKKVSVDSSIMYPYASTNYKLFYCVHTIYGLIIDENSDRLGDALIKFEQNLTFGEPQSHPVLKSFAEFLKEECHDRLGAHACLKNTMSALEFISGCIMDRDYRDMLKPPSGAFTYPDYFRETIHFAEPCAYFVFPEDIFPENKYLQDYLPVIQDLCNYNLRGNDILSFYKDSVLGNDRLSYIWSIARVNDIPIMEAIRLVAHSVADSVTNIRTNFSDRPELLRAVNQYISGAFTTYIISNNHHLSDFSIFDNTGNCFSKNRGNYMELQSIEEDKPSYFFSLFNLFKIYV